MKEIKINCLKCGAEHIVTLANPISLAIIIGHTTVDGGANSDLIGQEYEFWKKIALENWNDVADIFFHDSTISSYTARQKDTAKKTKDYDLVLEIHFNSSENPNANGAEVLYYKGNNKAKTLAESFLESWCKSTGINNRGAKGISSGNGYGFLVAQKPTALLIEPFFGSNQEDIMKLVKGSFKVALKHMLTNAKNIVDYKN
jgi:N-acetylmuramoyl-L-alanine amidase